MAISGTQDYDGYRHDYGWAGAGMETMENPDGTGNMLLFIPDDFDPRLKQFAQPAPDGSGRLVIPSNVYMTEANKLGYGLGESDFMTTFGPMAAMALMGGAALTGAGGGGGLLSGGVGDAALIGGTGADTLGAGALASEAGFLPGSFELGASALGPTAAAGLTAATPAAGGGLLSAINGALGTSITGGSLLSGALQAGLGAYGANQQANALEDVANQQSAIGGPFRDILLKSYTDPSFDLWSQPGYADAFQRASDIAARSVSAKSGNPYGNPGAMGEITNQVLSGAYLPTLSNYRGGLMQAGGMGLNTSGQASIMGAQNAGAGADAVGYGIATALNPKPKLSDYLNQFKLSYA